MILFLCIVSHKGVVNILAENVVVQKVRTEAEGLFERGELFCSEAVLYVINELLGRPFPSHITKLASAFPIGIGKAKCLCGAVSGGAIALGIVYGRAIGEPMPEKMFPYAQKLHDHVKSTYGSTCCRVLVNGYDFSGAERKRHCVQITGEVAAWVAATLLEDGKIDVEAMKNL